MFWGKRQPEENNTDQQQQQQPRRRLRPELQELADNVDDYDNVHDSQHNDVNTTTKRTPSQNQNQNQNQDDTTESPYRYAAYTNRIRTLLLSAHRYIAYSSDIGESFRPVAHPYLVRSAYGISWSYILGDVVYEGYKAYIQNCHALSARNSLRKDFPGTAATNDSGSDGLPASPFPPLSPSISSSSSSSSPSSSSSFSSSSPDDTDDIEKPIIPLIDDFRLVAARRFLFQTLASMALPAFTIHSVVKYSGRLFKHSKRALLRTWAPIGLGLSIVPTLPFIFDEPVEHAVDWSFREALRAYAGDTAIESSQVHLEASSSSDSDSSGGSGHDVETRTDTKSKNFRDGLSPYTVAVSTWEEFKDGEEKMSGEKSGGVWGFLGFGSGKGKSE